MLRLAQRNLARRPFRSILASGGLAVAVAVLASLSAFGDGYRSGLHAELDHMGLQMMLVPLGCPYDAAARVLKGKELDHSLPEAALTSARADGAVAVAAPVLATAVPRPDQGRTDMWVGVDRTAVSLKPWWRAAAGSDWFTGPDSVILGSEAAAAEMRAPGDKLFSPETGKTLTVAGVLQRSGTSDDSLFFVPLRTAQAMFHQPGRLTAVQIRLRDPALMREAAPRLQLIRGAQVVTLTEMLGTFLNLVGSVRVLLLAVSIVAVAASALTVFNTLLAAVLERTPEFAVMRALGASRGQLFGLIAAESLLLTVLGSAAGLLLAQLLGPATEAVVRSWVPFPPAETIMRLTLPVAAQCLGLGVAVGLAASLYPAWQASRLPPHAAMRAE